MAKNFWRAARAKKPTLGPKTYTECTFSTNFQNLNPDRITYTTYIDFPPPPFLPIFEHFGGGATLFFLEVAQSFPPLVCYKYVHSL